MSSQPSTLDPSRSQRRLVSSEDRRRAAMPRRVTKGPLEGDDLLAVVSPLRTSRPQTPTPSSPSNPHHQFPEPAAASLNPSMKDFGYLLRPENYHPLTQLTKEIPPAFRSSSHQPSPDTPLSELLSKGHFRTAAIAAAILLTTAVPPTDHVQIFSLLYIRLVTLTLINATLLASQEVKILEDLNSVFYHDQITNEHLVPWRLRVLAVRLQGIGFADWRRGVMGYYELAREARLKLRKAEGEERTMWTTRLQDLGIRVGNALVEMGDLEGAARHLKTLQVPSIDEDEDGTTSVRLALLYLRIGDVDAAREYVESSQKLEGQTTASSVLRPLLSMAEGQYDTAVREWRDHGDHSFEQDSTIITQNLAVCLLYTGRIDEARELLETLIDQGHSFHTLTFNLSTIYELCTEKSRALKLDLTGKVAAQSESELGWEKANVDFKL